jgi:hypothetical protein
VATFAGNLNLTGAGAQLYVGNTNTSTQSCLIQIGNGRTGSGQSYIDFVGDTTYTDFGMRLARDGGANGSSYIQHRGTGDLTLLGQDASAISLRTNNTERVRITSDGKVGISTGQPAVALQVNGDNDTTDGRIRSGTNTRYIELIRNASVDNWIRSGGNTDFIIDQSAVGNLIFRTSATERMRITSGGNVGIGRTPSTALDVSGVATFGYASPEPNFLINLGRGTAFNRHGYINGDGTSIEFNNQQNGDLWLCTNNTERLRITSSGNVGIGTIGTTPAENLHIRSSTPRIRLEDTDGGNANIYATISANTAATGSIVIQADTGNSGTGSYVSFEVDAAERMRITSSGNTQPGADNSYTLGASGVRWSAVWAANGTIQTSDAREKNNITNSSLGLNFINSLRPVSYSWNVGSNVVTSVTNENGDNTTIITPQTGTRTHWGLIAQEVKIAVDAAGVDFGGWVLSDKDDPDSQQALRYDQFIAPLIKAVQELSAKVQLLESKLEEK